LIVSWSCGLSATMYKSEGGLAELRIVGFLRHGICCLHSFQPVCTITLVQKPPMLPPIQRVTPHAKCGPTSTDSSMLLPDLSNSTQRVVDIQHVELGVDRISTLPSRQLSKLTRRVRGAILAACLSQLQLLGWYTY
jgi:hypothetical protein